MTTILEAAGLSKTFAGVKVLDNVDLTLRAGEVHALLGHNGSGKSTLIKILSGFHAPDAGGTLRIRSTDVDMPVHPGATKKLGLAFVHQDLAVVDAMSVVDNLLIGRFHTRGGWRISWSAARASVRRHLESLHIDIHPDTLVADLSDVDRARLAIARALIDFGDDRNRVLVLDEATASLPRDGVDALMSNVKRIRDLGHAVLLVTHRLEEVWQIADHVTVLRNGRVVESGALANHNRRSLVDAIVGFEFGELYPEPHRSEPGAVAMALAGVATPSVVVPELAVRRGEILGVTGLIGTGWEDLPGVLAGALEKEPVRGEVQLPRATFQLRRWTVRKAIREGVVLVPADRVRTAGVPEASLAENITLPTLRKSCRPLRMLLNHREDRRRAQDMMDRFAVVPSDPRCLLQTLSGGNQQKVVLAKWLAVGPEVVVLHEPTQGVDVGARRQIFAILDRLRDSGTAIVVASAEYEDLAAMCDRVLIFREGCPSAELSGPDLTQNNLARAAFGEVVGAPTRSVPITTSGGAGERSLANTCEESA